LTPWHVRHELAHWLDPRGHHDQRFCANLIDRTAQDFGVAPQLIRAALAYYADYTGEVDEDVAVIAPEGRDHLVHVQPGTHHERAAAGLAPSGTTWDDQTYAMFLRRLASMGRLVMFDKRGTGLSDASPGLPHTAAAQRRPGRSTRRRRLAAGGPVRFVRRRRALGAHRRPTIRPAGRDERPDRHSRPATRHPYPRRW
jgi:hypothetical protein